MKIRMLQDRFVYKGISLEKGKEYEVVSRAVGDKGWKIIYHRPRSTKWLIVTDDECEVINEGLLSKVKSMISSTRGSF